MTRGMPLRTCAAPSPGPHSALAWVNLVVDVHAEVRERRHLRELGEVEAEVLDAVRAVIVVVHGVAFRGSDAGGLMGEVNRGRNGCDVGLLEVVAVPRHERGGLITSLVRSLFRSPSGVRVSL